MNPRNFVVTDDMLASKGKRFGNYLIDLIPQYAFSYGLVYGFFYLGELTGNYAVTDYINSLSTIEDYIFAYAFLLLYYFIFESLTNRTLGKYATNTMVVMQDGSQPTHKDILIRSLSRCIPFDGLSFLGTKGKGWHDSLSKTYVVDVDKFESKKSSFLELDQIGMPTE